ncbi:MAG: PIN domain protein, partial [Bacteroidia bacterium]|nr:PIN domain protein [Bacteroidia bacterium]
MKFYVDTSVWGGFEDKEFSEWTKPFFDQVRQGKFTIVLSDVTLAELYKAPELIRNLPTIIPPKFIETVEINQEQIDLANKYVSEGVLTIKFHSDA